MSLKHRTYAAVRWTSAATLVRAVLQLLQIVVLARFLSPTDYGLMAMVGVILSYASLFSDFGLSTAFLQRQNISHEESSSLYWLSVLFGCFLMMLVMAASPLFAVFFREPRLIGLLMLVATNFFIVPLGQQLRVRAEKSLHFHPIAIIEVSSATMGFLVAVTGAWMGAEVYSLVFGSMASTWLSMVLSWALLARGWRPLFRLRWSEVHWFIAFGGGMVLNNVINHVNLTVDLLIGGRLLGASQLGYYSVPRSVILQIQSAVNPVFTRVGLPLIASMQDDIGRVREVYLKTLNMTASINAPIYVSIVLYAPELVILFLGGQWTEVVPILRALSLWGLLRSFANPVGSLLFGLGHVRLSTLWNAGLLLLFLPSVWLGSYYGSLGISCALALVMLVLFVPVWALLVRPACGVRLRDYARQVTLPLSCALVAGLLSWLPAMMFADPFSRLTVGFAVIALLYLLLSRIFNPSWCHALAGAMGLSQLKAVCGNG